LPHHIEYIGIENKYTIKKLWQFKKKTILLFFPLCQLACIGKRSMGSWIHEGTQKKSTGQAVSMIIHNYQGAQPTQEKEPTEATNGQRLRCESARVSFVQFAFLQNNFLDINLCIYTLLLSLFQVFRFKSRLSLS